MGLAIYYLESGTIDAVPEINESWQNMELEDLQNRFNFHPAKDEDTQLRHGAIRAMCLNLAVNINQVVPDGREKSLAITKLEEVMMWANAGIARNSDSH